MKTWLMPSFAALLTMAVLMPVRGADAELPVILATDNAALEAKDGQEVIVEGYVQNVGFAPAGGIKFLNFGPRDSGFVAVIFRDAVRRFEDGLDKFKHQNVRIRGRLEKYRESQMQIRITDPEQIEIVNPAP